MTTSNRKKNLRLSALWGALMLLSLEGTAHAQGTPIERLPIGDVSAAPIPSLRTVVLAGLSAVVPAPAPSQTGRCRLMLADGTQDVPIEGSNPPILNNVTVGAPYTCELEYARDNQSYLGQAWPPIMILPETAPSVTPPNADDAVTGLQANATASSLSLVFTPPVNPSTPIDGFAAVCVEMPSSPTLPSRYLAVRGTASPITVSGLLPKQSYQCSVSPFNSAGIKMGDNQSFSTSAAPPLVVQAVPTLSHWALLILSTVLAGVFAMRVRLSRI